MRLVSKINGTVAYTSPAAEKAGFSKVEIAPGESIFEGDAEKALMADTHFERHVRAGDIVILDKDGQPATDLPPKDHWADIRKDILGEGATDKQRAAAEAVQAEQPVKPGKGGKNNKGGDKNPPPATVTPEQQGTIDAYYAVAEDQRAAMRGAMTTEELALVDANAPK